MLKVRLSLKSLVQVIFSVTSERLPKLKPVNKEEPEVEKIINELEKQFGGNSAEEETERNLREQLHVFSKSIVQLLNTARIDSVSHFFIEDDNKFTAILIVTPSDARILERWFRSIGEGKE